MMVFNLQKKIEKPKLLDYFLRGIVLYAFLVFVFQDELVNAVSTAFIFLLMTVPVLVKRKYKTRTPLELDIALSVLVFLSLYLGSLRGYYDRFPWYDLMLHFFSGILLGLIGFVLLYLLNQNSPENVNLSPGFISFFAFSFSMTMSAIWEIFEFATDLFFGLNMQKSGLLDTMSDLIVNTAGALIVAIGGYIWIKQREKTLF